MNEKIKKIREKVILANNPNCKNYDEALQQEVALNKYLNDVEVEMNDSIVQIIPYYLYLKNPNAVKYGKYEFLGLPLTLERVLVACYHYNMIQPLISYTKNKTMSIGGMTAQTICDIAKNGIQVVALFDWEPNKTLDNQSTDTIESIYDMLFN
jgi:hypothetical protein